MGRQVTDAHLAMRRSEHPSPTPDPTHDIVAVSREGEELYVTESAYSEEEAREQCNDCNRYHEENDQTAGDGTDLSHVSHFAIRKR